MYYYLLTFRHSYDCRCSYDWTNDSNASSNTGSSDRSTALHQAYEAQWDNWTANHSPPGTPTLTRLPSPHMQFSTLMILYLTRGPQMLSESTLVVNAIIFASWTLVQIASLLTMTPCLKIPTQSCSHLRTQKFMGSAVQSMHQCKPSLAIHPS